MLGNKYTSSVTSVTLGSQEGNETVAVVFVVPIAAFSKSFESSPLKMYLLSLLHLVISHFKLHLVTTLIVGENP